MLNFQKRMGKTIIKLATLKSSTRLNLHQLREEHNEGLNAAEDYGATEFVEELDNLRQILEDKKVDTNDTKK